MLVLLLSVFLISGYVEEAQSWSPPATVGKNPEYGEADVAIDVHGNAIAVFGCTKPIKDTQLVWLEASRKPANGSWSSPVRLTPKVNTSLSTGVYPKVCLDPQGNAVAIWNFLEGDQQIIQTARLPFGSSEWVVETMPQPSDVKWLCCATLQMDQNGRALATWNTTSSDDKYFVVSARLSSSDAHWTMLTPLEIPYDFVEKHLHLNSAGIAWMLFMKSSDGWFEGKNVNVATLSPDSSTWSTPETIQSGGRYGCPQIVSDLQGNVLATWQEYGDGSVFVAYQRLQGSTEWKKTDFPKNRSSYASHGWLSLDREGNALFVWSPDNKLMNSHLAQGQSSWTAPELVSNDEVITSKCAIDSKGNRLVSWISNDNLKTATLSAGETTWTAPFKVTSASFLEDCQLSDNGSAVILYSNSSTLKAVYGKPF
ncbi:MAG: hypothetical protein LLG04_02525 [Parachlamydia sp.]|nr:hypothetical protein [Parachlamydia sp.]